MINIIVNGLKKQVTSNNLSSLIVELEMGDIKIATALNGEFIAKEQRSKQRLQDNDKVEIVTPMSGG